MHEHYILLYKAAWAGPTAKRIKGPATDLSRGRPVEVGEPFEYLLQVNKQAGNGDSFPALDFHRISGQTLFSNKFQNVLSSIEVGNIQFIPAKVIYEPTGVTLDYQLGNVLGVVKALDTGASECTFSKRGSVLDFNKMVLNEDNLKDIEFARIYEMLSIIVISEKVASALLEANISGIRILKPSEWLPGMI